MKNRNVSEHRTRTRTVSRIPTVAVVLAGLAAAASPAYARVTPPLVPASIRVPQGNVPFLEGHGIGTQNYVCVPAGVGFAWSLFTPQATLPTDADKQVTTHFFSPNPAEDGVIRPTWPNKDPMAECSSAGGIAPATGCSVATDVGRKAWIPYTADYFFYEDSRRHEEEEG
jgi:hypothetical protein